MKIYTRKHRKTHKTVKNTLENIGLTLAAIGTSVYFTACFVAWNAGYSGLAEALTVWF